jgi:hypothetical protein
MLFTTKHTKRGFSGPGDEGWRLRGSPGRSGTAVWRCTRQRFGVRRSLARALPTGHGRQGRERPVYDVILLGTKAFSRAGALRPDGSRQPHRIREGLSRPGPVLITMRGSGVLRRVTAGAHRPRVQFINCPVPQEGTRVHPWGVGGRQRTPQHGPTGSSLRSFGCGRRPRWVSVVQDREFLAVFVCFVVRSKAQPPAVGLVEKRLTGQPHRCTPFRPAGPEGRP